MSRPRVWFPGIMTIAFVAIAANGFAAQDDNHGKDKSGKYRGLDRNNDGVISRSEWRGNAHSFTVHDKNGDGVLSGNEIGPALDAERYDDFAATDGNHDGRISRSEWRWTRDEYDRLDHNRDGMLTRQEYLSERGSGVDADSHFASPAQSAPAVYQNTTAPAASDRYARFIQLDRDGNGRISRKEWDGDSKSFNTLDANSNGDLSRDELLRTTSAERKVIFKRFDLNGNGTISRTEWRGDKQSFARFDQNNDGKVQQGEFANRYRALEQRFDEMDRDHRGTLSREEWSGQNKTFNQLDDNTDGQISLEEFVVVLT